MGVDGVNDGDYFVDWNRDCVGDVQRVDNSHVTGTWSIGDGHI